MAVGQTTSSETPKSPADGDSIVGMRVAFVGKLGGLNRREARKFVREQGGVMVDSPSSQANLVVIGADELPSSDYEKLLDDSVIEAARQGLLQIINETEFWQRMGMDHEAPGTSDSQYYTPAMLAELLELPITTIRRWQRRGLIRPARQVNKLPYFDFQEVASARRIAKLIQSGDSPKTIESKLQQLATLTPELQRPLSQLSIIIEGRNVLLRRGEGLIEPGGQKRIDFDAIESPVDEADSNPDVLDMAAGEEELSNESIDNFSRAEQYVALANQFEDQGELDAAVQVYRAMLLAFGPTPESSFRIAELLYLLGDVPAARERYFLAVELDETYVEARASLGCVLAELGQPEMAVSAFRGALDFHADYPDVHFHLARVLDDLANAEQAEVHWRKFIELAPRSPWAEEARERLL